MVSVIVRALRRLLGRHEHPSEEIAWTEPTVIFTATITRCGCGDPDSHSKLDPPQPCPQPRAVEEIIEE